jgi:hypothetical protein
MGFLRPNLSEGFFQIFPVVEGGGARLRSANMDRGGGYLLS